MTKSNRFTNQEIAELLRSVAAAYEIKPHGASNRFRIVAYQKAADAIEHATSELKDIWEEGKLNDVPGIGSSIASHIDELFRTGRVKHFDETFEGLPEAMFALIEIPGIGAKKAYKLTTELGIEGRTEAIEMLEKAAQGGKIRELSGFGEDSESEILKRIAEFKSKSGKVRRMVLPEAVAIAEKVVAWLKEQPDVIHAEPLGSLRRQVSTVGDVDVAVASNNPTEVIKHFVKFDKSARVIEAGRETSSIVMPGGAQIDLMVQPPEAFGALLQHFTGSKHHNIALREYALKQGLSLSEHGIKLTGKNQKSKLKRQNYNSKLKIYQFPTEVGFYGALGLDFIPPELREDTGEIEAAATKKLPDLVELKDVKGDFHLHSGFPIHTSHDDGAASFSEMIKLGEELGYEYIGFSEHNPATSINSEKQIVELVKRKNEAIEKINYSLFRRQAERVKSEIKGVYKVFNGLEVDIKPSGKRAIPDSVTEYLDYMIVSVHSSFRQNKKDQTRRVIEGLSHPKARIFGHPTGRKLNERDGIDLDWDEIFEFCKKHNKFLEVNSWYDRLDLPDMLVQEAVRFGVKLVIDTDSHALDQMHLMRYGVSVARRGWAEKKDIVNTLPYSKFVEEFAR